VFNYVYDRFGNRWQQNGPNSFIATFTGNNPGSPANNNRMDGYSYDAAGNLMNDGAHGYIYDAENRLIKVDAGSTATYVYNAEGQRVQKTSAVGNTSDPAGTWVYLYDQSGRWVQKLNSPGNTLVAGNIFAGGRHVAAVGGTTNFSHSDWLGTERLRTTYAGVTCETIASLPFGDGLATTGSCYHPSALHFTGKERDAESGLDNFGARFDASSMGRFMSPDPQNAGASPEEPQSWNGYAYAGNNSLNFTDPDGLNYLVCGANGENCADLNQEQYDEYLSSIKGTNTTVDSTGLIQNQNANGSFTTIGQATYYDEKNADAAAYIAGSQLLINEFVKQVAINVAIGAIGRGIGLGIEGIQAARAARAATAAAEAAEAVEVANLAAKAAQTVGYGEAVATSKSAALAAGEEFVGPGAQPIVDRTTGQIAGKISSNGTRVYRITSLSKPQPYVNLENKVTGGNLHVRF
jgi:RHS repeat-associated protein